MGNGKVLGLDIGIASVGVGVIDSLTGEIIHANSRIFPAANADNNIERRNARGNRRLTRRKKHRLIRVRDLFNKYNFDTNFKKLNLNPYELRVKGLTELLSNEELFAALKNISKHRGISYLDDAEGESSLNESDYSKAIDENQKLLKNSTPGQIQLNRLKKYGQLRGNFTIQDEDGTNHQLINVFSTSEYRKEADRILETQAKYNKQISKDFISDYIKILTAKRKYYIGPGNEKSRTDYGVYRKDGTKLENLFGILIGKCTFYPDEFRAAKASYTAQEFNFLNDLNNLTVPTETKKLSTEQKRLLVDFAKNTTILGPKKLLQKIAKLTSCKIDQISGFRLNNKDQPDMHTFETYRSMKKLTTVDVDSLSREILDKLAHILTLNTDREGIEEAIKKDFQTIYTEEQIKELTKFRKSNNKIFGKGWHNFSTKLMLELIPELYDTSEEQMTILTRLNKTSAIKKESKRTKYINENDVTEEIYNPVVAKSVRQAIKIINALIKKYGEFDQIVVEMPRESNEEDERKFIADRQKANAKEKNDAEKQAAILYNGKKELSSIVFHGYKDLTLRIRLWHQQNQKCLYSGKEITINDLIHNRELFEIDHVLPLSLSFDDSLANKVLVYRWANQEKGQRTPFQALDTMANAWSYREMKSYISSLKNMNKKKRDYLLTEEDINKIEVKQKFIERNLVDTRYASRVVLNTLQDTLETMNYSTRISVVRGQFTSQLRRKWKIEKSRDTYHHHAVDALIIAASSQLKLWKKQTNPLIVDYKEDTKLNLETGELLTISDDDYKELVFQAPYSHFERTISSKEFESKILFSYQVDSKFNRKISDATIYTTRTAKLFKDKQERTYVVGKIKDIYSQSDFISFKKIYKKDKSKFLMFQKDPLTWNNVIEVILKDYPSTELNEKGKEISCNPFEKYRLENGYIRKYSKKGKGTEVKSLNYYDKSLGNHIDITPKGSSNNVVLQSLNPWRTDVYFNLKTMKYELLGLKYKDLHFEKGSGVYKISLEEYERIKINEGVDADSEFKFTLYKNDLILIKDTESKEELILRFNSKNDANKHYIEFKPVSSSKFLGGEYLLNSLGKVGGSARCIKGINKLNISIYKVKTDILGNQYYIKKEGDKPKLDF